MTVLCLFSVFFEFNNLLYIIAVTSKKRRAIMMQLLVPSSLPCMHCVARSAVSPKVIDDHLHII
jgi:hypothetical protein